MKRIAIIGSRGFPSTYGGYETLVRYLARDWTQRGYEVTVYCRARKDGRRSWMDEGVRCQWTPGYDSSSLSTLSYGATAHLHAAFQKFDAALVLNIANGFFLPMLKVAGVPTALNTDGIEWERGKWGRLARRIFLAGAGMSARYADLLVADSKAIADIWQQRFLVDSRFIPYGAEVIHGTSSDSLTRLELTPRGYVLVVARLIPENNVGLILDAIGTMGAKSPEAVVVGTGNRGSALERRLESLHRQGKIRWLGHVDDQKVLQQLWSNSAAYIHGHSVGGTNPALLQALGAGAPTLALDTRFSREVLGDDGDEQLFPHDAQTLAQAIGSLVVDRTRQERFSDRGREIVRQRYSWPAVSDDYIAALYAARASRS